MKDMTPLRMEATDQAGTHVSGWKSLIERQRRVLVLKRPLRSVARGKPIMSELTRRGEGDAHRTNIARAVCELWYG